MQLHPDVCDTAPHRIVNDLDRALILYYRPIDQIDRMRAKRFAEGLKPRNFGNVA